MANTKFLWGMLVMVISLGITVIGCETGNGEEELDQSPTVTAVTVSPATAYVLKGETQSFSKAVIGTNGPETTVTWSIVETGKHEQTTINGSGLLTVNAAETLTTLTVKATSTADTSKSGTATVTVRNPGDWPSPGGTGGLTSGSWTNSSFTADTIEIWYSFNATNGNNYYIWCNDSSGTQTFDAKISVYYNNGTPIFSSVDDSYDTPKHFTAERTGRVYVCVYPSGLDNTTGTFSLVYSTSSTRPSTALPSGATRADAIPLTWNTWASGTTSGLNINDSRWYKLSVASNADYYYVWYEDKNNSSYTGDIVVSAYYNANETMMPQTANGSGAFSLYPLGSSGTIYLKVSRYHLDADQGTFRLKFNTNGVK